jgi:hypothetical protein
MKSALAAAAMGIIATLVVVMPVLAGADLATPVQQEPDHPLPPGCGITDTNVGKNFEDAEVEPFIDVDRSSGKLNVIGVYQQDRWSNGGAHGLITDVSHDGGASFTALTAGTPGAPGNVPAFDRCTGGATVGADYERSSDPWVTFAPNGDAYQIAISFFVSQGGFGGPSAVLVSKSPSSTHGTTWQLPMALRRDTSDTTLNDKESITADPNTSNNVYAVWDRLVSPSESAANRAFLRSIAFTGPTWFSRTTNAGSSWETARIIFNPGEKNQTIGNVIVVTPSHPTLTSVPGDELVDSFALLINKGGRRDLRFSSFVGVIRSFNQGASWTGETNVDQLVDVPVVVPATGAPVRTGDLTPQIAVDRSSGAIYVVWQDGRFTGQSQIAFSESTDGGATWSPTIRINDPSSYGLQTFNAQVHVADDGTVGVVYYQIDTPAGGTSVHVVHCHAASANCTSTANWNGNGDTLLPGSNFDITTAPVTGSGFFVGDYVGLTDFGSHGFRPFLALAQPAATKGPTDPFSDTVCPTTGGC